jgi:hypothetical protein
VAFRLTPYKRIASAMPHKRINAKSREADHGPRQAARGLPKGSPPSKSGGGRFACAGPQAIIKGRASRAVSWPLCGTRKRVYLAGGMARAHRKALSAIQAAGRLEGARSAPAGPQAIIKGRASRAFSWPLCGPRKRPHRRAAPQFPVTGLLCELPRTTYFVQ